MITQTHVLLYGGDSPVSVLGSVLTSFHHEVRHTKTFGDLVELPLNATVDLLIFGASVPRHESDRVFIFASARWPQLRTLRLTTKDDATVLSRLVPAMSDTTNMVA